MTYINSRSVFIKLISMVLGVLFSVNLLAGGVRFDFSMAEQGIQWLKLIRKGAAEPEIRQFFMNHVAPTGGCQSIIHHWARFMEWDNEKLYKFILEAMGKIPSERKVRNEDGTLTRFGARREMWTGALNHIDELENRVKKLKAVDFEKHSLDLARKFLPETADIDVDFYFVLFGGSNAYAVGKENGMDLLQVPLNEKGNPDVDNIVLTIAHELHHCGFTNAAEKGMSEVKDKKNILLLGILAAEGMPTYFIDKPYDHLDYFRSSKKALERDVAADWEKHSGRIPELYQQAEKDLELNLTGKISRKQIINTWLSGSKGAAYILGSHMMSVIHQYLGVESARTVAEDYREFITTYNQAAELARQKGEKQFKFKKNLAEKILNYR